MNRNCPPQTSSSRHVKWLLSLTAVAILSATAALLLPLIPTEGAQAQPSTVVRVSPAIRTVSAGTDIDVNIFIDDVAVLGAYEFELAFPPNILGFLSVTNGPFLGSTGRSVICQPRQFGAGSVRFGCSTEAPPPPDGPTGSGLLATVRLSTFSCDSGALNLVRVVLSDTLGTSIPTNVQNGSITVTCVDTPTPVPTATPTLTATATATPTPTATDTPAPGVTPEPSATVRNTPTATATPTATFTATPTATTTGTATHTWTPEPTWTQVSTWTPVPTWTAEPTWTPEVAGGPTHTPIPTSLATATSVPLPTFGTPTATPPAGAPPSTGTPTSTGPATTVQTPTPTSTPTLVGDIGPVLKTPAVGLPDTGGSDESSSAWLSPASAIVALSTGVVLLAWSQLLWWRRRRGEAPVAFQPQFRPATTRRQEQPHGPR
ncbi:MAG: hypothetical protein IIC90_12725 [Chloroflexi bacterium]|nr:hypothetical protein [Chloroflexota bacterium]